MKQFKSFLMFLLFIVIAAPLAKAEWSETDRVYYIKNGDGKEEDFTVDGSIIYKNSGEKVPNYKDNGVVFVPKNAGEVIKIEVEEISFSSGTYICVYDFAIEQVKSGTSDGQEQSGYLPAGWALKLDATSAGTVHYSNSEDGKLSFGFHSGSGATGTVRIKVSSVVPAPMSYSSVEAVTLTDNLRRGAKKQIVAAYNIIADGVGTPLVLDNMKIAFNATVPDVLTNVALYKGNDFTDKNRVATLDNNNALVVVDNNVRGGDNIFYVLADVDPDASGVVEVPQLMELIVAGVTRDVSGVTAANMSVDNTIYMTSAPTSFTISSPVQFYDDGGESGKISQNFNGTITFVPATPGSKIKVDFTDLSIFNTSTVGKNDILKFYNGSTAEEANLITTLLKEAEVVKSTADDGSMTITLTSTTGVPANGWKAIVSQYVPGPMSLQNVSATVSDDKPVSAGDKTVAMLLLDVQTENNASPLKVEKIGLASADASSFAKTSLYYLGAKSTAKPELIGDVDTDMTVSPDKELIEGHNYFLITADMAESLVSGGEVSLSIQSVTVSGSQRTVAVEAKRAIDNVCRLTEGTHSHTVNGEWKFLPEMNSISAYENKYATGTSNRVVTFYPGEEGAVVQLDFSDFDVYYSSSSYGTKAEFAVYSGESVSGENLLWKLTSADKATTGPGCVLRSAAANGAMTVCFNPKSDASYYTSSGWTAAVKNFKNHDMSIVSSEVRQTSVASVAVGEADAAMIDFTLVAEGTLTAKNITGITLSFTGAEALSTVKVYTSNSANRNEALLFGQAAADASVTVEGEKVMSEGPNYFWVEADVKTNAPAETHIDVALTSVKDKEGATDNIENGNPEGDRIIKLMAIMKAGVNEVVVTQALRFYDDGGIDGKIGSVIGSSEIATYTFIPSVDNHSITFDTKETFSIGNGSMMIYSGRVADNTKILGTVTGYSTTKGPEKLVSKAADGSLTVVVKTPTGKTLDGFDIEVGLHEKVDYSLSDVVAEKASEDAAIVRGSMFEPLLKIKLDIVGDKGESKVNTMTFSLAGTTAVTDFAALHLYFAGNTTTFNPNISTLLGSVNPSANEVTIPADKVIGDNGTYYFYLAGDFAQDAVADNVVCVALNSVSFNDQVKAIETPAAAEFTLKAGISGTFTIGENGDYADFDAAVTALETGVEGSVTFNILPGTYTSYINISNIKGTSEVHQVVFKSADGNRESVIVKPGYASLGGDNAITVTASPWFTFRDMTFDAGNQPFKTLIAVVDRSHHFTLENSLVKGEFITSGSSGVNLLRTVDTNESGRNSDYITVRGCTFEGGYIPLYISGTGMVALPRQIGAVIEDNIITDPCAKGIYVASVDNVDVRNNTVITHKTTKSNFNGIDMYRALNCNVTGNKIAISNDTYSVGIYLRDNTGGSAADHRSLVANNDISILKQKQYGYGMQITAVKNVDIAYNTIRQGGTDCYGLAVKGRDAITDVAFTNNLVSYEGSTTSTKAFAVCFDWNDRRYDVAILNNTFYVANEKLMKNDTDEIISLSEFNALFGDDAGNRIEQPDFLGEAEQHLKSPGNLRSAKWMEQVKSDRDGLVRDTEHPTFGAYEYTELSYEKPIVAAEYPKVTGLTDNSAEIRSKWSESGRLYVKNIEWSEESLAPTADDMKLLAPVTVQKDIEYVVSLSGLAPSTKYITYLYSVSLVGVESDVVATQVYETLRHIEPLVASISKSADRVDAGSEVTITAEVAGGDTPYTYEWRNAMNEVIGTEGSVTLTPQLSGNYTLKVTSADGQSVDAMATVFVSSEFAIATFEDNYIPETKYVNPYKDGTALFSGSFAFNGLTQSYGSIEYWGGVAFSSDESDVYESLSDQYRSAPGGGYESDKFAVVYGDMYSIDVASNEEGEIIDGLYITNSAGAYESMSAGDDYAKQFAAGDWFKITVKGIAAGGETTELEYYLADFRNENSNEHYIVNWWEWLDLSSLGKVKQLAFTFDSSDKTGIYLNTPTYFCIDNLGADKKMSEHAVVTPKNGSVNLAQYFDHANNGAAEIYSVSAAEGAPELTLNDNIVTFNAESDFNFFATMTSRGHSQYAQVSVEINNIIEGVDNVDAGSVMLYPTVVDDMFNVATSLDVYSLEILTVDGRTVKRYDNLSGSAAISRGNLSSGIYIVRITADKHISNYRLIVR